MNLSFRARPLDLFEVVKTCAYVVAVGLGMFTVYSFVRWPIVANDTDLWYHLNAGRYIWANGAIPRDSFFSFITPPRPWVDYYWLFQAVIFKIYTFGGYPALIVLRATLYAGAIAMIGWFLLRKQEKDEARLYVLILFSLYVVLLMPRYTLVRPHMVTYLLLIAFLWILEAGGKSTLLLPVLGVLWANLHGGAYPVMILAGFAYLVETGLQWVTHRATLTRSAVLRAVPIVVAMNTIYLTPHGLGLLGVPFTPTGPASRYILEFRPVQMDDLLAFAISTETMAPTFGTTFNLILVAACAAALASAWRRRIRVSHLLLLAGAVVLLAKGTRFRYEFALLALPLIAANPLIAGHPTPVKRSRWVLALVATVSLVMSISNVSNFFGNRPRYPMSRTYLPVGVAAFLNRIGTGGRLLNYPNAGGYLQWMLYPKYKIFMDMQVPFLFTDEDMVVASSMYGDPQVLRHVLDRYSPDFIVVWKGNTEFKGLIAAFPDYAVVFFDDTDVLYASARKQPEAVRASAVNGVDPFTIATNSTAALVREKDTLRPALDWLLTIDPGAGISNQILGILDKEEGASGAALSHAEAVVASYPESPSGYRLKGQVLRSQHRLGDAVRAYRQAIERTTGPQKLAIQRELGGVYKDQGQYEKAYRLLRDSMNVFDASTTYRDLYELAEAALLAGRNPEAALVFRLGAAKVPAGDKEWVEKYRKRIGELGAVGPQQ